MHDRYRIKPGTSPKLADYDPADAGDWVGKKDEGREALCALNQALDGLQARLYAEHRRQVLVVLQGMDTSGKDGTIRAVFEGVNPQGVRVTGFKAPTAAELDHDFLWRVHAHVPGKGEIAVFNRSHYEDVLAVRVLGLVPKDTWKARFDRINEFERLLADEGTLVLKFFLHIGRDEQKARLLERLDDPAKNWKLDTADLAARRAWDQYVAAYEDVLARTSTAHAPWYVVPADRKWYRNLVVAGVLVDALGKLDIQAPPVMEAEAAAAYREALAGEG